MADSSLQGDVDKALLLGQKRVLELMARGAPLADTLTALTRLIEAQEEGLRCGILIVTDDGEHFRRGSGSSLPEAYHQAFEGVPITPPYLRPCGEAAHAGKAVVVPDIANDVRWEAAWRNLVLSCGLAACHAIPVRASDGRVLACFAMYYERSRAPTAAHSQLVEIAAHLAGIALERERSQTALRATEARLAAELAATQRLQEISTRLIQEGDVDALYSHVIDAACAVMRSDAASIQMLDPERGELRLLAWKGFHPESAAHWQWVRAGTSTSCSAVLSLGKRVIVPDVETCNFIVGAPDLDAFRKSGIRAVQSTPLLSRSGRLLGVISTHWREPGEPTDSDLRLLDVLARQAADLIERARGDATLRKTQAQLRTIFDETPMGVYLVDADFRIRQVNPTALPVFGDIPDLIGRDFDEVIHILWPKEYADEVVRLFRHTLETGEPYITPERIAERRDRGVREYYEWRISRVPLREGRYGVVCYFRDISAQVFARQAIAASEERLRELNEGLERKVLERTRALEAEVAERQKTEAALQQAQRLEAIGQLTGGVAHDFNNLLTVVAGRAEVITAASTDTKIAHSAAAIQRAAERGARLVGQLLAFARRQKLRPVAVTFDRLVNSIDDLVRRAVGEAVEVEFSAGPAIWPTLVDLAQCESAILNLTLNARDAMPSGGRLVIAARNASVAGNESTRLDLAPGDYIVISVSDTGTGMPPDVRERAFVLVVEDQPEVRDLLELFLDDLGYRTLTASDGVTALKLLQSNEPIDLLLTDVVMPNGISGVDLAQEARRMRQDLKVLLVSGFPRGLDGRAARIPDGFALLEKPFRHDELAAAIAHVWGATAAP